MRSAGKVSLYSERLKMISAQVVETSVTNNRSFQNNPHPDDHAIGTTDAPGFKPFTRERYVNLSSILKPSNPSLLFLC